MGNKIILLLSLIVFAVTVPQGASAQEDTATGGSGLPIPRFVSLRSDKVFVRTGPALRYPIQWVFQLENLPVEVIQEFDTWRKIRDHEGQEGWIHQSLTQGKRYGLIQTGKKGPDAIPMTRKAMETSKPVALLERNVIVKLEECNATHCKAIKSGYKGWIERKFVYGIYGSEKFD